MLFFLNKRIKLTWCIIQSLCLFVFFFNKKLIIWNYKIKYTFSFPAFVATVQILYGIK